MLATSMLNMLKAAEREFGESGQKDDWETYSDQRAKKAIEKVKD